MLREFDKIDCILFNNSCHVQTIILRENFILKTGWGGGAKLD